jgi:hypothetical protein
MLLLAIFNYVRLLLVTFGYWRLFHLMLLFDILSYITIGYWWLLVCWLLLIILLVAIGCSSIGDYYIDGY